MREFDFAKERKSEMRVFSVAHPAPRGGCENAGLAARVEIPGGLAAGAAWSYLALLGVAEIGCPDRFVHVDGRR